MPGIGRGIRQLQKIYIRGVELTQSIQWYEADQHLDPHSIVQNNNPKDNSIPLIAGKPLLVRVFLRNDWWFSREGTSECPDGCMKGPPGSSFDCIPIDKKKPPAGGCESIFKPSVQFDFTGTLEVSRRLKGTQYLPMFSTVSVTTQKQIAVKDDGYASQRGNSANTLEFIIPAEEIHGFLRLHLTVIFPNEASEEIELNVDVALKQTFKLRGIMVHYNGPNSDNTQTISLDPPTLADLQMTSSLALRMFPVQSIADYSTDAVVFNWWDQLSELEQWTGILYWFHFVLVADGNRPDVLYYGLLPAETPLYFHKKGAIAGIADINGVVGTGRSGDQSTMAHELGHLCGLYHAPCGSPDDLDLEYTPDLYSPHPSGSIGEFGAEIIDNGISIYPPDKTTDIMSYCFDSQWISPHNYMKLFYHPMLHPEDVREVWSPITIYPKHPIPEIPQPDPQPRVISIIGVAHSENKIEIKSVARLQAFTHVNGGEKTGQVAELVNEEGKVVSRAVVYSLRATASANGGCCCRRHEESDFPYVFQSFIPNVARGAALRIRRGEKELWTHRAPETETCITEWRAEFVSDGHEQSNHGHIALEWQAVSAGRQEVEAWVQWSDDSDKTWRAFVTGLREHSASIDAAHLPSGQVSLRLLVNDGFDTALSEPITVQIPRRDAIVTIFTPADGNTIFSGTPMRLWAAATGDDGLTPPPETVQWVLNGNQAGKGLDVFIIAPPAGQHRVTLIVSVNGRKTERTVNFETVRVPNLPSISKTDKRDTP